MLPDGGNSLLLFDVQDPAHTVVQVQFFNMKPDSIVWQLRTFQAATAPIQGSNSTISQNQ
jgi:hypothetical protein